MKVHFILAEKGMMKPEKKKNLHLRLSPIFLYFLLLVAQDSGKDWCSISFRPRPPPTSNLPCPSRRSDGLMIAIDSPMMKVDKSRYAGGRLLDVSHGRGAGKSLRWRGDGEKPAAVVHPSDGSMGSCDPAKRRRHCCILESTRQRVAAPGSVKHFLF